MSRCVTLDSQVGGGVAVSTAVRQNLTDSRRSGSWLIGGIAGVGKFQIQNARDCTPGHKDRMRTVYSAGKENRSRDLTAIAKKPGAFESLSFKNFSALFRLRIVTSS